MSQLKLIEEDSVKGEFDGITLKVTSGHEAWQVRRTYDHFCKLDEQLHQCVFDRNFSELPILSRLSPKSEVCKPSRQLHKVFFINLL